MAREVTYETIDTHIGERLSYRSTGNFGKSAPAILASAFVSPINTGDYTAAEAARKFAEYAGENVSYGFGMYSRNFTPVASFGAIYDDPRNKSLTPVGAGGLPATPYSPNVASPGEGNGNDPRLIAHQVVGTVPVSARPYKALNPSISVFQNQNSTGFGNEGTGPTTGKVRTFRLGIGSGTVRDISNP
jgi:hypothetical protein